MAPRDQASPRKRSSRSPKKAAAKKRATKKAAAKRPSSTTKKPARKAPAKKRASRKRAAKKTEARVAAPLHPDPDKRWRPRDADARRGPTCGYTLGGKTCRKRGAHYCEPRADKVVLFYRLLLVHTVGPYARRAFVLEAWQELDIIRPLFGEVIWSAHWGCYVRRYRKAYIVLGRKNGKALALDTPIPTPDGWTTMGEIRPGAQVIDDQGQPTTVIATTEVQHGRPCYRVSFSDGSSIVADAEHEWPVKIRGASVVRTTAEMARSVNVERRDGQVERRYSIPVAGPITVPDVELPIGPYTLGAWLGDGTSRSNAITTADVEVLVGIEAEGYEIGRAAQNRGAAITIGIGVSPGNRAGSLIAALRASNLLGNKHIPPVYQRAGHGQRLALLQGLMDTDGHVTPKGQAEFTTTSSTLAEDVVELVAGLGLKPTIAEGRATLDGRDCGPKWRIQFWPDTDRPVVTIPRKAERLREPNPGARSTTRQIVAIERTESVPVRCIEVDSPSSLYLAGPTMIPTHNSGISSGTGLYLTVGDDEEAAHVYCAAKDTKQAGKVFEPATRMRELSPTLAKATGHNKNKNRIYYPRNGSYFEIIIDDAKGELGHNPHGFILDEFLAVRDGSLWGALVSAAGARLEPLFLAISTETNEPASWGAKVIDEAERIQEDPARAPDTFVYARTSPRTEEQLDQLRRTFPGHPDLPVSLDWTDEANWWWPNPALGTFLNIEDLRADARSAMTDPVRENEFRQYRLNQRVSQVTRWMPLDTWNEQGNIQMVDEDALAGRSCFAGLDLSATTDLTSWCLLFPPIDGEEAWQVVWRFWTPEAMVPFLAKHTGGQIESWVRTGWIYASEGDWIDYEGDERGQSNGRPAIHPMIAADARRYRILSAGYDAHMAVPTAQHMQRLGLKVAPAPQGYGLSPALKEIMRRAKAGQLCHGGNPVMQWNVDSAEVKRNTTTEAIQLVKPDRDESGKRVDGLAALANAVLAEQAYDDVRHAPATATGTDGPGPESLYRPAERLRL